LKKSTWPDPSVPDSFQLTKLEAAQRQLSVAIRMLFGGQDPVAVHTLAGAASIVFTDLVEHIAPENSWDRMAQEDNDLSPSKYFNIIRQAQNFLKHARNDHTEVFDFDPNDTDALTMLAVMNASEVAPMSPEAQVFQLWFLAARYPLEYSTQSPFREAIEFFGDLRTTARDQRLLAGQQALERFATGGV
jgi:hypothetical protein